MVTWKRIYVVCSHTPWLLVFHSWSFWAIFDGVSVLGGVLAELERAANYELWAIVMVVSRAPKDLLTSSWSHSYSGSTLDSWFTFKKKWIYILCKCFVFNGSIWSSTWGVWKGWNLPFGWWKGGFSSSEWRFWPSKGLKSGFWPGFRWGGRGGGGGGGYLNNTLLADFLTCHFNMPLVVHYM